MKRVFFAMFAVAITLTSYAIPTLPSVIKPLKKPFKVYTANEQFIVDAAGFEYNPCNGELVYFEGRIHYGYKATYNDKTGAYKSDFHANSANEIGIGDQGNRYNISFVNKQSLKVSQNGCVFEETYQVTYNLVSKGSADNFRIKETVKVIWDFCNWTFEIVKLESTAECTG